MKSVILRKTVTSESKHFFVGGAASTRYFEADEFKAAHKYAIAECVRLGLDPMTRLEYAGMPDYLADGKRHSRNGYQSTIMNNLRAAGYSVF